VSTRRRRTAARRQHPLVDGAARTALDALEDALGHLAEELSRQEQAAAAGPGTLASDIRARLSDPTPARVVFGDPVHLTDDQALVPGEQRDARGPDGARYGDEGQIRKLREAKLAAVAGLNEWARWVTRETWGPYGQPCDTCGQLWAPKHRRCHWPAEQCPHKQATARTADKTA
jgi:hypothetical protein